MNYSDPFGLCPKAAGGDGKMEGYADCPKGSSGYYANEATSGRGGLTNDVNGAWATLNFDMSAQLPENTLLLEMPAFGRGPAAAAGKITGYTKHGLNQAMSRDGVGVGTKAILDAVKNPSKVIEQSGGAVKYIGANATVILNKAGEVVTTWAKERERLEDSAMMRHGYGVTDESLTRFISEIVRRREPSQLGSILALQARLLSETEREALRELLADELIAEGLGPDSEPNEHGRMVETAIDWLGCR